MSLLAAWVVHRIYPYADCCCPQLDPGGFDHFDPPHHQDHHVGLGQDGRGVCCLAVHDGGGGIAVHEEHGNGQSHQVGLSHRGGVLATELDAAPIKKLGAPLGGAHLVEGEGG